MDKFLEFREKYKNFYYHGYDVNISSDEIEIVYHFEIEGLATFEPRWVISNDNSFVFDRNDPTIDNIIFNIGMIEVVSYLKATCSKNVIIEPYVLTDEQKDFYKKLFFNGLGEFFYKNNIDVNIDDFIDIKCSGSKIYQCCDIDGLSGNLVLIGGGKDSLVTLNLLKNHSDNNKCYILNAKKSWIDGVIESSYSMSDIFNVKRYIDKNLIELNSLGYLNGHTPLSALLAMSSLLVAYLLKKKNICVSNEASANEPTVKNTNINHQYSKSIEFENDFRDYCSKFISPSFNYYSILRPLSEYQIAKYFSKLTNLHHIFHSCNIGSKTDIWCCNCPKCLFIYTLLSAFLSQNCLESIFGVNMLNDMNNKDNFEKLIGVGDVKPFECVGSVSEINFAIKKAIKNIKYEELPLLLKMYRDKYYDLYIEDVNFDSYFDNNNNVPSEILDIIKDEFVDER